LIRAAPETIVLDRDGTIVVDRHYLDDPRGLEFEPGAAEGLQRLHHRGHRLVVITNQSGVGRGRFSLARLAEIHDRLESMVESVGARLSGIYFCPHLPDDRCSCRKPELGLLRQAAADLGFDPRSAVVIGDKMSDVEFGARAGARTVLIAPAGPIGAGQDIRPDLIAADLLQAADWIDGQ
jgi:D-glycero-D-manno-heptose 1,7-bisphosphate phosphatase